jgi:YD repeat-containing protein
LGSFGQVPVGLFTGTPQLSIPLFELNVGKINLPISLSYSSNGVRVDEIAGNVGLGWNLNAGGVITRSINDEPDESMTLTLPDNFPGGNNYQEILTFLENAIDPESGYDTFSDLYSFNFNGYSGSFYLDASKQPVQINPSPVKILRDPPSPYSQYEFIIIDPYGVIYCFGNTNSTETSQYRQFGSGHNTWTPDNPTSWYLSRIQSYTGDYIDFTYTSGRLQYVSAISQGIVKRANGNSNENLIRTDSNINSLLLNSISSRNGTVNFSYSQYAGDFYKLDDIELIKNGGGVTKSFILGYDVVNSSKTSLKCPDITYEDEYGKRLFLKSVTEKGDSGNAKKPYLLSYYSPEQIPPRFSYAQDYWGYYNGVSNNEYLVSNGDYYLLNQVDPNLIYSVFSDVGGDKKPNGTFGKNGLLKKIAYPTGGSNELFYEPHSYYGTKIIPPPRTNVSMQVNTDLAKNDCYGIPDPDERTDDLTIGPIPFDHSSIEYPDIFDEIMVPINISTQYSPCFSDCSFDTDPVHDKCQLRVKDEQNANVMLYLKDSNGFHQFGGIDGSVDVHADEGYTLYISLEEGKSYNFHLSIIGPSKCIHSSLTFSYYATDFTEMETNIEIGGSRIQKIVTDDGEGGQEIKKYHYGDKDCLDCSSGIAQNPKTAISYSKETNYVQTCFHCTEVHTTDALTLTSSTVNNLYGKQGHQIGYTTVIEEIGNNFAGGGVYHQFNIVEDIPPGQTYFDGYPVAGTPFTTSFGNGEELKTEKFKKVADEYITLQETVNHYSHNTALDHQVQMYGMRLRDIYGGVNYQTPAEKIRSYDISPYLVSSEWHYLDSSTVTDYDESGNPKTITTTEYHYDNPDHLQPTRVVTSGVGDDKTLMTKTDYPNDLQNDPYMGNLIAQHRIAEPVQVRTYQNKGDGEELLSTQKTEYGQFGSLYLPEIVQTAKGAEPLENRLVYSSYDSYGNLREVYRPNGSRTVYVMGYDFTLPVAKLENISLGEIAQGDLNAIYSASGTSGNETLLLQKLDALRAHISALNKAALVTTLTYIPLVGVHTMTDPKGFQKTYEYDGFGRLQYVKDRDGNVLGKNEYHYKN